MSHSREVLPANPRESLMNSFITRLIAYGFMLGVFFPFVRVVPMQVDVQPTALFFAILLVLCVKQRRLPLELALLFVPVFFLPLILWIGGFNFSGIRGGLSYVSLFIIASASYFMIRDNLAWSHKFLKAVILIWLVVGTIEMAVDPEIFSFLLPRLSTTLGRGVVGLAPEPTFYGIACLFMGFILIAEKKMNWFWALILLFQIVFLARSSMVILFLLILASFYVFFSLSLRLILWISAAMGIGLWALTTYFEQEMMASRIYILFQLALKSPLLIFTQDASGNDRFLHIFFSVLGFFDNFTLPHGFGSFASYMTDQAGDYHSMIVNLSKGDRIMSGYGSALFELGFLGLFIPAAIFLTLWRFFAYSRRLRLTYVCFFSLIMFSAIQLSFPPLAFMLGFLAAKTHEDDHDEVGSKPALET